MASGEVFNLEEVELAKITPGYFKLPNKLKHEVLLVLLSWVTEELKCIEAHDDSE